MRDKHYLQDEWSEFNIAPSRRIIKFLEFSGNVNHYFLNLPKMKFLFNKSTRAIHACFLDKQDQYVPMPFPNISIVDYICLHLVPRRLGWSNDQSELPLENEFDLVHSHIFETFLGSPFLIPVNSSFYSNFFPFLFGCNCLNSNYRKKTSIVIKNKEFDFVEHFDFVESKEFDFVEHVDEFVEHVDELHVLKKPGSIDAMCPLCNCFQDYVEINCNDINKMRYPIEKINTLAKKFFEKWEQKSKDKTYDFIEDVDHFDAFEYLKNAKKDSFNPFFF